MGKVERKAYYKNGELHRFYEPADIYYNSEGEVEAESYRLNSHDKQMLIEMIKEFDRLAIECTSLSLYTIFKKCETIIAQSPSNRLAKELRETMKYIRRSKIVSCIEAMRNKIMYINY